MVFLLPGSEILVWHVPGDTDPWDTSCQNITQTTANLETKLSHNVQLSSALGLANFEDVCITRVGDIRPAKARCRGPMGNFGSKYFPNHDESGNETLAQRSTL